MRSALNSRRAEGQEERRAMDAVNDQHTTQYLLTRYRQAALGFWRQDARRTAWLLTVAVFSIALLNSDSGCC